MDDMLRLLLLHASINIVLISYICFPKKNHHVIQDPNVAKKICLLLLSNNFSSKSYGWGRNAQSAAAHVFLVNLPLQSCRRSRIDQDKEHIFELLVPQQSTHAEKSLDVPLL